MADRSVNGSLDVQGAAPARNQLEVDETESSQTSSSTRSSVSLADDGATPPIPSSSSLEPAPSRSEEVRPKSIQLSERTAATRRPPSSPTKPSTSSVGSPRTRSRFGRNNPRSVQSGRKGATSVVVAKGKAPGFINEWTDPVMLDLRALLDNEESAILSEQRINGSDKRLVEISVLATESLLERGGTALTRRYEIKRVVAYRNYCLRKNVPAFPISSELVRIYLVESQYAKPGLDLRTLESVRKATAQIWDDLPGIAVTSLEETPRLALFVHNSEGFNLKDLGGLGKRDRDDTGGSSNEAASVYSIQGYKLDGFVVDDEEENSEVDSPRQKPRSSRKPAAPTLVLASLSPSTSSRSRPPKIVVSSAEPESADDSEIPSPTKRTRTTATPLVGTSTNLSAPEATSTHIGASSQTIQQSQTSIQQQQQSPAVSLASLVVPTSSFAPALPLALSAYPAPIPLFPQQPLVSSSRTPLSLSELERLILSFSSLSDHRIASTLHAFGITTRESFTTFVFLEADGEPLKEVFEALEEAGVPPFRRNVLWRKLAELRTAMSD